MIATYVLLGVITSFITETNALTCCCTQFTMEECDAVHDTTKGHCVWRTRPSYGPSTGEKGICRTEQWVEIQKDSQNHHPMHTTTTSTLESIPFISLPKKSADPLSNDDIIAHESDPANPDNYDWPNVCFTVRRTLSSLQRVRADMKARSQSHEQK